MLFQYSSLDSLLGPGGAKLNTIPSLPSRSSLSFKDRRKDGSLVAPPPLSVVEPQCPGMKERVVNQISPEMKHRIGESEGPGVSQTPYLLSSVWSRVEGRGYLARLGSLFIPVYSGFFHQQKRKTQDPF